MWAFASSDATDAWVFSMSIGTMPPSIADIQQLGVIFCNCWLHLAFYLPYHPLHMLQVSNRGPKWIDIPGSDCQADWGVLLFLHIVGQSMQWLIGSQFKSRSCSPDCLCLHHFASSLRSMSRPETHSLLYSLPGRIWITLMAQMCHLFWWTLSTLMMTHLR